MTWSSQVVPFQSVEMLSLNLAPIISLFLRRDVNKAFARVTGGNVYPGAGYGLEIIYGPKPYVDKIREVFIF